MDFDGVITEIGHLQVAQEQSAIGVRVIAHAALSAWREFSELASMSVRTASENSMPRRQAHPAAYR
jgi:glycerol kinase